MQKEEYEDRGFPFRDFLLKLILVAVIVFLIIWFVPRFISMNKNKCNGTTCSNTSEQSKMLSKNLEKMKKAGINYYSEDKVPVNNGDSSKITLKDMIKKSVISSFNTDKKIKYDEKSSYIEVIKEDNGYVMNIYLKSNKGNRSKTLNLNNYEYCDVYLCEKDKTKEDKKDDTEVVEDNSYVGSYSNTGKTTVVRKNKRIKKYKNGKYKYKYIKTIKPVFSKWSNWSSWMITNCSTKKVSCSDDSTSCLKKVDRYDKKVQTGTVIKKYEYPRTAIKNIGYVYKSVPTSGIYVIVNNKLYRASTNYTFSLVERNKQMSRIPNDSLYYHYEFVSKNHYNVYRYNGTLYEVVNASGTSVRVLVYGSVNVKDVEYVKEPVYKTTCYKSVKTRKLISKGKTLIKWSKYNDYKLIKNGWILTKTKKKI